MQFDGILVLSCAMVLITALVCATKLFPRSVPEASPKADPAPSLTMAEVQVKIAEALKPVESESRMLRTEWTDMFDKFKRMEARRYAREKRAEPSMEEDEPVVVEAPSSPVDGVDVEVMANRRMLGL